jgi:RimJ/RimL family protein N-acetyltransferase
MGQVPHPYWPLFDLRIRTPRLELRVPDDACLIELAGVAAAGIHPRGTMPFSSPWTDRASPELERGLFQWHWRAWADWQPANWRLSFTVLEAGRVVGIQALAAQHFAILRTVDTGSWLGLAHQGRGIGTEMRAAVLHFAFAGLGAVVARSAAFADNVASLTVSRSLGYVPDGEELAVRRGTADRHVRLRLDRELWEPGRRHDIVLEGLGPCLPLLGLASPDGRPDAEAARSPVQQSG